MMNREFAIRGRFIKIYAKVMQGEKDGLKIPEESIPQKKRCEKNRKPI